MSEDAPMSRKEKRAKRDAERAAKYKGKGKKEVPELTAVPGDDLNTEADAETQSVQPKAENTKKRKRSSEDDDANAERNGQVSKDKSNKRAREVKEGEDASKKRFIIFVGNLPYSTTEASLERHFEKLKPFSLRHRTDPQTKKSKGFAFLEFENYDRLKTCLKLYHHSYFDPENPDAKDSESDPTLSSRDKKKSKGRRINVMLSAGGGGNTEARKEKIKVKNERLEGQRQRRADAERKEKEKERKKKGLNRESEPQDKFARLSAKAAAVEPADNDDAMAGVHPSRRKRYGF